MTDTTTEAVNGPVSDQTPEVDQESTEDLKGPEDRDGEQNTGGSEDAEPDTFDRAYVERLRRESAKYRDRASDRDALAERLHRALVEQDGRLADPADLPYEPEHLDSAESLTEAIDALLEAKPHFAAKRLPETDLGQGKQAEIKSVTWADVLRG